MKQITIGRKDDNNIVFPEMNVSGHHCRCYENGGKYYVEDTNSKNGVRVDGNKISQATEITPESEIGIGPHTIKGAEIIERLKAINSNPISTPINTKPTGCEELARKYEKLIERYRNNMAMFVKAASVESHPYTPLFPSDDEKVAYMAEEYSRKMRDAIGTLQLISKSSRQDALTFRDDMDILADLCRQAEGAQKEKNIKIRERIYDEVIYLQRETLQKVASAFQNLQEYYHRTFAPFYETTTMQSPVWKAINNKRIITLPYLLYGYKDIIFPLFEESYQMQYLQFLPFLNQKNLILHYDSSSSQSAQDVVNGMLGRMLAGSQSGNVQICVFDPKDLGGTSNMLKMLDRHVYTICARTGDMQAQLSMLDRYVENVVQNLLQGPYTSLASFNKGKEKQEPYQIIVLKDFPFGITPDMAHTIQRIIANGIRAGVQFIFMVNDDLLKKKEDCIKIGNIMHLDEAAGLQAEEIDLTKQPENVRVKQQYATLSDDLIHDIVQYVNAGFEIKTEEVLRLTDYMASKEEWWTGKSASRADIPFGMASNKQIQKINFTQESGQNAAVVIGIPGSGKSVFLHAMIASAMVNYSPRELQMYLLDFSGVEFNVYANHKLPHARVIAPEAEREFGLSILKEVFEEGKRRMDLCRSNDVTNIVELKRKNPDVVVPRLLVIIDEFQKIFEIENDNISKEANTIIHAIIQEYRKFGINLVLATQKLPAKSIVPYDLIANRVVFKSDPNDFNNLIKWSHSVPQPRLLTGTCIYNNESGAEVANYVTRSFFINASKELEDLLDEVSAFAKEHPEMTDDHQLRVFRSNELPDFSECIFSDRHINAQEIPREVGVYLGESIAISPCHVYVPLTKDSNNNILIIGGVPSIAKGIAYHAMLSAIQGHTEKACTVIQMNFMMDDDPMQAAFQNDNYAAVADYANVDEVRKEDEVKDWLLYIKNDVIDVRKRDSSQPLTHFFINIFDFQRGRMFDGTGGRGDMQSECSLLLEYIVKNGPMVGVFTMLQVDNLANLSRLGFNAQNSFCHRIALQMSERDSDKVVGNSAANKLLVLNRPATNYRALYYNDVNNSITKFKPYKLW